jgi:hypothetical protein
VSVLIADGTLCLPQNWMFGQMREALGIDNKADILAYIESLPSPEEQQLAHAIVEKVEEEAMRQMVLTFRITLMVGCPGRVVVLDERKASINAMLMAVLKGTRLTNCNLHTKQSSTCGISNH